MEIAREFIVFIVLLLMGVVMMSSVLSSAGDTNVLNNYTVNITENPEDGSTLTVDSLVFEFDNNSLTNNTNIPVIIASDVNDTTNNLRYAIGDNTGIVVA